MKPFLSFALIALLSLLSTQAPAMQASRSVETDANGSLRSGQMTATQMDALALLDMGTLFGSTANTATDKGLRIERQALGAAGVAAGDILAWANPTGASIIVTGLVLDVTTGSSGASTIDCGIAANGTTLSDILIDGVSGATAGALDHLKNAGTNGAGAGKATSSQYVTCSEASGDTTGLVGYAYIYYHPI